MVQKKTLLKVVDNSGASWSKCISILGSGKKKTAFTGDIILVTITKVLDKDKIQKRVVYLGLIVCTVFWSSRLDGSSLKFFSNKVLLFSRQYKFLGSRIYGIFTKGIKQPLGLGKTEYLYLQKILSYSALTI